MLDNSVIHSGRFFVRTEYKNAAFLFYGKKINRKHKKHGLVLITEIKEKENCNENYQIKKILNYAFVNKDGKEINGLIKLSRFFSEKEILEYRKKVVEKSKIEQKKLILLRNKSMKRTRQLMFEAKLKRVTGKDVQVKKYIERTMKKKKIAIVELLIDGEIKSMSFVINAKR